MVRLNRAVDPQPSGRRRRLTPDQAAAVAGLIDACRHLDAGQVMHLQHDLQEAIHAAEADDDRRRTTPGREG